MRALWMSMLFLAGAAHAAQFVVDQKNPAAKDDNPGTAEKPFATINKAAQTAGAGDTVTVKAGVYREYVGLYRSGTANAPIQFNADPPGSVIVTGADVTTDWEPVPNAEAVYSTPWKYVFSIGQKADGSPMEFHPESHELWGRCEQAIVDGKPLLPCLTLDDLNKAHAEHIAALKAGKESPVIKSPLPGLGGPFVGMFAVDTRKEKRLYLWLADGTDPRKHTVELATRDLIIGSNPWAFKEGTQHVHLSGFVFRYAANFCQRPSVWLHGANNLVENCVIEEMSNAGLFVRGTVRRCVIRNNGHCGGGAYEDGFVNEETLWEGNSWKPIERGWEAGGIKLCRVDGGVLRKCVFRRNGGPGLWFDIHARNILVTDCVFWENEYSGIMIEISRNIRVIHNLAVRNAVDVVGKFQGGGWSSGGIQIAESMNCDVSFNTCVGNKDGITFREQGPRIEQTPDYGEIPYHDIGDIVVGNVCVDNAGFGLGLWWDNNFFGWHPGEKERFKEEEEWQKWIKTQPNHTYDPVEAGLTIDRNVYFKKDKAVESLYGVPWRPKHKVFTDMKEMTRVTGFDARSRVADPGFEDAAKNNFRPRRDGLAWQMQVGWLTAPADIDAWMKTFLPPFR
jgi:hypothetical protein